MKTNDLSLIIAGFAGQGVQTAAEAFGPMCTRAAELAREALERNLSVREVALAARILDEKTLLKILDVRRMTQNPAVTAKGPVAGAKRKAGRNRSLGK